jgi:hypothetical protein
LILFESFEALASRGHPHADWVVKILRSGCFQMP